MPKPIPSTDQQTGDRPMNKQLLSLVRQLRTANAQIDRAVRDCDNHYQAGFDQDYFETYQTESDQLRAVYMEASDERDRLEQAVYDLVQHDPMDFNRAVLMAERYAEYDHA